MVQKTCLNHRNAPAAVQCFQCHKPVCNECRVTSGLGEFCSDTCAERYADFKASFKGGARQGASLIVRLVQMAVAAAVLLGAVHAAHRFLGIDALASFDILGKFLGS